MSKEYITGNVERLSQVKSKERSGIYAEIVHHALESPRQLVSTLDAISEMDNFYSRNLREKITSRIRERFLNKEEDPDKDDMEFIISQSGGPYEALMFDVFHGYMDRPVKTLSPTKMTAQSFADAAMEATSIAVSFAQALTEEEDAEKLSRIMSMWQESYSPDVPEFTANDVLSFFVRKFDTPLAHRAGAVRSIINSMEVIHQGEFILDEKTEINAEALTAKLDKLESVTQIEGIKFPYVEEVENTTITTRAERFRKKRSHFETFATLPAGTELENTALLWILKKWERLAASDDARTYTLRFPGRYGMLVLNRGGGTQEEEHERIRALLHESVSHVRGAYESGKKTFPITESEFDTLIAYGLPDIEGDIWGKNIDEVRLEAAGGLYSLSHRGDRIVFDDENESDLTRLGIESLTVKKEGAGTRAEFRVFGTPISVFLDRDYEIQWPDHISDKSRSWIATIVYSYLSELRNNMADPVGGQADGGGVGTERVKEVKGVRPFLRVLPERHKATMTSHTNERCREEFGFSLGYINTLFGTVQMHREFPDELPPNQRRMIENLLSRIEEKGVEPYWVEDPEPLMLLGNPQSGEDYDPLTSVFRVAFVEEHEVAGTDPKDVRCTGAMAKIHSLVGT